MTIAFYEFPHHEMQIELATEAATRSDLLRRTFSRPEYLREPTSTMIDGEPPLRTRAEIIDAPTVVTAGDTITIVAETEGSMQCDLVIHPSLAMTTPPPRLTAPASGIVRWQVQLSPAYRGPQIEYEFRARVNSAYRAKVGGGEIAIDRAGQKE